MTTTKSNFSVSDLNLDLILLKVDSYHDCEENEIVKWFPLYEGDAMFPAKFVMFQKYF